MEQRCTYRLWFVSAVPDKRGHNKLTYPEFSAPGATCTNVALARSFAVVEAWRHYLGCRDGGCRNVGLAKVRRNVTHLKGSPLSVLRTSWAQIGDQIVELIPGTPPRRHSPWPPVALSRYAVARSSRSSSATVRARSGSIVRRCAILRAPSWPTRFHKQFQLIGRAAQRVVCLVFAAVQHLQ